MRGDGGISDAEKWIKHRLDTRNAVQFDAPLGQLNRKRRRMRTLLRATLNRFVRNEPGVAAAARIAAFRMRPARYVAFILIRNSEGKPINFDTARFREVKNVFVASIREPFGAHWLKWPYDRTPLMAILDRDRFDPVNHILQNKHVAQLQNEFMWQHRTRRSRSNIKKK